MNLGTNLKDNNPRLTTKRLSYSSIKDNGFNDDPSVCPFGQTRCTIRPTIKIIDSWGYTTQASPEAFPFPKQIIVKKLEY